jgi:hypothetical protein
MNFLSQNPLKREEEGNVRPNYTQVGQAVQQGPSMTQQLGTVLAPKIAEQALASTAGVAATAALGPAGFLAAPAMGVLLGSLFNNGTTGVPGYMNGTQGVPEMDYGPDPLQGYMNGTDYVGYNQGTNMAYAGGTDSVPAMLTPGEAVIPAAAAQNPQNKPAINAMVAEGRQANAVANSTAFLNDGTQEVSEAMPQEPMMGPLSGKSQREKMKVLQDMSLKKKAWEAEEARKQKAFEQKYAHNDMKAMLSMRQS